MIKIENIYKSYHLDSNRKEVIFENLSLSIPKNQIISIYGPSGCGKTSLLNLMIGLDTDYQGNVTVNQTDLSILSKEELTLFRKEHIGFIFQNFNLISHLNVNENIKIPLYLEGKSSKEIAKRVDDLLSQLGLSDFKQKNVTQLSGGQKQRVAIARALANNPEIIVADEPTGSLDTNSQLKVLEVFKTLKQAGKTIIIVTHNPEVAEYSDVIIKMKDGKIIETIQNK